jgi:hypothetical protein
VDNLISSVGEADLLRNSVKLPPPRQQLPAETTEIPLQCDNGLVALLARERRTGIGSQGLERLDAASVTARIQTDGGNLRSRYAAEE